MRNIYRPVCHGIPGRCPAILGGPAAVCYRCSGFFLSLFLGCTVVYPLLGGRLKWEWSLKAALGATVLSGVQWLLEFLEWIPYSPWLTGITGLLWGGSLSLLLCSSLRRIRAKRN